MTNSRQPSGQRPDLAYFEAFSIVLAKDAPAAQQAAAQQLAAKLDGEWRIETVGAGRSGSARIEREFLLSSRRAHFDVAAAWDRAAELAQQSGVASIEPLFSAPGLEPSPKHLAKLLTKNEQKGIRARAALGSGSDKHRPCAENPLWSLEAIRAPQAWAIVPPNGAAYGEGCVIGHIDTGYTDHGEIWDPRPRILAAQDYDFESDDPDARDPLTGSAPGHGTATASVIMSSLRGPESKFVNGVAPRASLIPVRVSGGVIHLSFANVVRGIHHCVDRGAHVISMSLGGPVASASLERAISRAVSSGVIVLAAAGNVWPNVVYPARYPDVIAVAATNCEGRPWTKSASGAEVDVSAPGESVWRASAEVKNGTPVFDVAPSSGTSYAVANAAGACALWLAFHRRDALIARYRAENLAEIFRRQLLDSCVQPSNWNSKDYGKGIVDAERLLTWPLPTTVSAGSKTIARGKLRRAARLRREPRADAHGARPRAERPANPSAALARAELEFRVATSASWREAYASRARDSASLRALAESEASALLSSRLAGSRRIQAKRHSAKKGRKK